METKGNFDYYVDEEYLQEVEEEIQNNTLEDMGVEKNDSLKWTRPLILALLSTTKRLYNDFDFKLKKNVWNSISKEVEKLSGIKLNGQQCDTKFKLLKKKYKLVKLNNSSSGRKRLEFDYYRELDEILAKRPEVNPEATCSSDSSVITRPNRVPTEPTNSESESQNDISPSSPEPPKKKPRISEVQRRHEEKMSRQDRFLDLMEKMINKM